MNMTANRQNHVHDEPAALRAEVRRYAEQIADLTRQLHEARTEISTIRHGLWELRSMTFRYRWRKFTSHRLTALPHYPPRPINIPKHYTRLPNLAQPPAIAMVTPSFQQGHFLERTLKSVLDQEYPRLEYAVQDGGSQDDTAGVLGRYQHQLRHWASHPDRGQAHAINLGFQHVQGEIMAYLNSDDLLLPGALHYVADYFQRRPNVDVIYGHRVMIDEHDAEVGRWILPRHDNAILGWVDFVPQETLFWRRRIWDKVGGAMDESFQFALDWDLLLRFRDAGAKIVRVPRFLGAFRLHGAQKTSTQIATRGEEEIQKLRERCFGRPVFRSEVGPAIQSYIRRHVLYRHLYRFGLLRY
ncbi:MAG: glycosyltransferase [Gemmataceae bacterium]|nr:glycosyltransferase [Gemmataceae bacterium]